MPPTGGGNRGSLPRAPSVRGPPNSAETCSGFRSQSTTNGYSSGLRKSSYIKHALKFASEQH